MRWQNEVSTPLWQATQAKYHPPTPTESPRLPNQSSHRRFVRPRPPTKKEGRSPNRPPSKAQEGPFPNCPRSQEPIHPKVSETEPELKPSHANLAPPAIKPSLNNTSRHPPRTPAAFSVNNPASTRGPGVATSARHHDPSVSHPMRNAANFLPPSPLTPLLTADAVGRISKIVRPHPAYCTTLHHHSLQTKNQELYQHPFSPNQLRSTHILFLLELAPSSRCSSRIPAVSP